MDAPTIALHDVLKSTRISSRTHKFVRDISKVDESKSVGRAGDKEKLMGLVLGDEDVSVIPIVGFGGLFRQDNARAVGELIVIREVEAWGLSLEMPPANVLRCRAAICPMSLMQRWRRHMP